MSQSKKIQQQMKNKVMAMCQSGNGLQSNF